MAQLADLYCFFSMVHNLVNWMIDMTRQMSVQEKPRYEDTTIISSQPYNEYIQIRWYFALCAWVVIPTKPEHWLQIHPVVLGEGRVASPTIPQTYTQVCAVVLECGEGQTQTDGRRHNTLRLAIPDVKCNNNTVHFNSWFVCARGLVGSFLVFTTRAVLAQFMPWSFVCLSVTSRSSTKMAKHGNTQTMPYDSAGILVFSC